MLNVEYHGDLQTATFIGTQSAAIQQSWCQLYDAMTRKVFLHFKKKGEWHDCILQREKQGEGCVPACLSMALACLCCSNAWPWSWLQAPKHAMYGKAWTSCSEIPCSSVILKESSDDHANHQSWFRMKSVSFAFPAWKRVVCNNLAHISSCSFLDTAELQGNISL